MSDHSAPLGLTADTGGAVCDDRHLNLPPGTSGGDEPAYCCFGCRLAAEITP